LLGVRDPQRLKAVHGLMRSRREPLARIQNGTSPILPLMKIV